MAWGEHQSSHSVVVSLEITVLTYRATVPALDFKYVLLIPLSPLTRADMVLWLGESWIQDARNQGQYISYHVAAACDPDHIPESHPRPVHRLPSQPAASCRHPRWHLRLARTPPSHRNIEKRRILPHKKPARL